MPAAGSPAALRVARARGFVGRARERARARCDRLRAITALAGELRGIPIDILLNNAGVYGASGERLGTLSPAEWIEVLRVNTIAPS